MQRPSKLKPHTSFTTAINRHNKSPPPPPPRLPLPELFFLFCLTSLLALFRPEWNLAAEGQQPSSFWKPQKELSLLSDDSDRVQRMAKQASMLRDELLAQAATREPQLGEQQLRSSQYTQSPGLMSPETGIYVGLKTMGEMPQETHGLFSGTAFILQQVNRFQIAFFPTNSESLRWYQVLRNSTIIDLSRLYKYFGFSEQSVRGPLVGSLSEAEKSKVDTDSGKLAFRQSNASVLSSGFEYPEYQNVQISTTARNLLQLYEESPEFDIRSVDLPKRNIDTFYRMPNEWVDVQVVGLADAPDIEPIGEVTTITTSQHYKYARDCRLKIERRLDSFHQKIKREQQVFAYNGNFMLGKSIRLGAVKSTVGRVQGTDSEEGGSAQVAGITSDSQVQRVRSTVLMYVAIMGSNNFYWRETLRATWMGGFKDAHDMLARFLLPKSEFSEEMKQEIQINHDIVMIKPWPNCPEQVAMEVGMLHYVAQSYNLHFLVRVSTQSFINLPGLIDMIAFQICATHDCPSDAIYAGQKVELSAAEQVDLAKIVQTDSYGQPIAPMHHGAYMLSGGALNSVKYVLDQGVEVQSGMEYEAVASLLPPETKLMGIGQHVVSKQPNCCFTDGESMVPLFQFCGGNDPQKILMHQFQNPQQMFIVAQTIWDCAMAS